ncbi:expressed protein, partial [Phakopsora pachyrhizi]
RLIISFLLITLVWCKEGSTGLSRPIQCGLSYKPAKNNDFEDTEFLCVNYGEMEYKCDPKSCHTGDQNTRPGPLNAPSLITFESCQRGNKQKSDSDSSQKRYQIDVLSYTAYHTKKYIEAWGVQLQRGSKKPRLYTCPLLNSSINIERPWCNDCGALKMTNRKGIHELDVPIQCGVSYKPSQTGIYDDEVFMCVNYGAMEYSYSIPGPSNKPSDMEFITCQKGNKEETDKEFESNKYHQNRINHYQIRVMSYHAHHHEKYIESVSYISNYFIIIF